MIKTVSIIKIKGDGRCLFRALAQGYAMATRGKFLTDDAETRSADALRETAVKENCKDIPRLQAFGLDVDETCRRMLHPGTYGREPEIVGIVRAFERRAVPMIVDVYRYRQDKATKKLVLQRINKYTPTKNQERKPLALVRILYRENTRHPRENHFDLLVPTGIDIKRVPAGVRKSIQQALSDRNLYLAKALYASVPQNIKMNRVRNAGVRKRIQRALQHGNVDLARAYALSVS